MKNAKLQFKNENYDIKKRSYNFSLKIINFLGKLPKDNLYQTITKQLLRSATSIGANIIEAQAASSRKDFQNFMNHALKSSNETLYWLYLLKDGLKLQSVELNTIIKEASELSKILGASMLRLRGRK